MKSSMAKTTVAKGPEITAENATEPVDHHNDEVSQSATLVLRIYPDCPDT